VLLTPLAVVAAPAAHAGGTCHTEPAAARGDAVAMEALCFQPATLFTEPGATVTFTNHDPAPHNVTGHGFQWGTGDQLAGGEGVTATFADPGVYAYSCTLHPGMVGAVVVGDPLTALAQTPVAQRPAVTEPDAAPTTGASAAAAPEPEPAALRTDVQPIATVARDGDGGIGTGAAVAIAAGAGLAGAAAALSWRGRARGRARG
jgi:plastocyanin